MTPDRADAVGPTPCPWCGKSAEVREGHEFRFFVFCSSGLLCGCGPVAETRAAAIASWNEVAGQREELAGLRAEVRAWREWSDGRPNSLAHKVRAARAANESRQWTKEEAP